MRSTMQLSDFHTGLSMVLICATFVMIGYVIIKAYL